MKRIAMAAATALLVSAGVVGCGGGGGSGRREHAGEEGAGEARARPTSRCGSASPQRELSVIKDAVKEFEAREPAGQGQASSAASTTTRSSRPAAVARRPTSPSRSPPTTPARSAAPAPGSTSSRTWSATGSATAIFPPAPRSYTQFEGTRCALPMLADALRPLLQRGHAQEGGAERPAEDDLRAHRVREEADRARTPTAR